MSGQTLSRIIDCLMMVNYCLGISLTSVMLMLDPLRRFSLKQKLPIQFSFADLYILMGMLSVTGLFLSAIGDSEIRAAAIAIIWLALGASWYYGVRLVSRSGISVMRERLLIQLVATPLAACGPFFILAVFFYALDRMPVRAATPRLADFQLFWIDISLSPTQDAGHWWRWMPLIPLVLLYFFVPRRLARQAIAASQVQPPQSKPPQTPSDAPPLDPHLKDLKLK